MTRTSRGRKRGAYTLPAGSPRMVPFIPNSSVAVAALVWLACSSADRILGWLGPAGARVMWRVSAVLPPCIGTQITLGGVTEVLHGILRA